MAELQDFREQNYNGVMLLSRLSRLLGLDEPIAGITPEDDAVYRARQTEMTFRVWGSLFTGLTLLNLLWWPSDLFIFRGQPKVISAFAAARGMTAVFTLSSLFLIWRVKLLRRHSVECLSVLACINFVIWGYEFGEIGGPGMLWFNFLPQVISGVIIIALPATARVVVSLVFALSMVAGYFGLHPQHLSDPYAAAVLSSLFCSVLGFSGVGFITDHFRRQAFFYRLAAEQQAQALATLNSRLESRVAEQTSELRALSHRLENAREQERTHIARELHDELGQELTALRLALKFTRVRHRQGGNIDGSLEELESLLARTTATTRGILVDLRPRVLDDLGLPAATEWLVERTRQRLDIPCRLELPSGELHLSDEVATTAFRILQEALTNVMRHSKATRVDVVLRSEPERIELLVKDDGVGIGSAAPDKRSSGLGVVGMKERALAIGGELLLESSRGQGTSVLVRLPRLHQPVRELT